MTSLTQNGCMDRQRRLRERLAVHDSDAAFLTDYRDIYYFTGALLQPWPACLAIYTHGGSWLAAHSNEGVQCVDDFVGYESHTFYTYNPDPMRLLNAAL